MTRVVDRVYFFHYECQKKFQKKRQKKKTLTLKPLKFDIFNRIIREWKMDGWMRRKGDFISKPYEIKI